MNKQAMIKQGAAAEKLAANTSHGVMHNGGAATHLLDNLEIGTT